MKMIKKEVVNKKIVITVEQGWFIFKTIKQYEAQKEFLSGYWNWLKLPDRTMVPDYMSFQLDKWNRL